jgi:RNA polymerase sigma-70 factor (ECF subfamily)
VKGGDLSAIFQECGGRVADTGEALEQELRARVDAGRSAWSAIVLEERIFVRHLASHARDGHLPPATYVADLWLACACAHGLSLAIAEFDRLYRTVIQKAAARVSRAGVEEDAQRVLVALLVREGDRAPRIAEYGGRAPLRVWLATVATRIAIDRHRRRDSQRHESVSALADVAGRGDPELHLARARYAPEMEQAIRCALERLDPRHCLLLRLHHIDGCSIDRLGKAYGVGRSTAARWVNAARVALLQAVKSDLRERLRVSASEVDAILVALQSDVFEISLMRLLAQMEERGA